MTYQYVFGRAGGSSGGYRKIASNDKGMYSDDLELNKYFYIDEDPPENTPHSMPVPIMFLNCERHGKKIAVLGRSLKVSEGRDSKLNHFYIFDGVDRRDLLSDVELLFAKRRFVDNGMEISESELNGFDIEGYTPSDFSKIMDIFNMTPEMLKVFITSAMECAFSSKEMYVINDNCENSDSPKSADKNLLLLKALFSIIPPRMTAKLGFITYTKNIKPIPSKALVSNIKIRFVEDSRANRIDGFEKEDMGHFIFNMKEGTYTNFRFNAQQENFLNFIAGAMLQNNTEYVQEFYEFTDVIIEGYSNFDLDSYSKLYDYYTSGNMSLKIAGGLVPLFNYFNAELKEKFLQDYLPEITKETDSDIESFLLSIFEEADFTREFVIDYYSNKITNSQDKKNLDIMDNEKASEDFVTNLRDSILNDEKYRKGGELYIDESLNNLRRHCLRNYDFLIKSIALFRQISKISLTIFSSDLIASIFEKYIYDAFEGINISEFRLFSNKYADFVGDIPLASVKANFIDMFKNCLLCYLEEFIESQAEMLSNTNAKKNVALRGLSDIINLFEASSLQLEGDSEIKVKKFLSFLCDKAYREGDIIILHDFLYMCENFPEQTGYMCEYIVKSAVSQPVSSERLERYAEEMILWNSEHVDYIISFNHHLQRLILSKRETNDFLRRLQNNDSEAIKTKLKNILTSDEIYGDEKFFLMAVEHFEKMKSSLSRGKKNFDYTVLPYVFAGSHEEIFEYLPNIEIAEACVEIIENEFNLEDRENFLRAWEKFCEKFQETPVSENEELLKNPVLTNTDVEKNDDQNIPNDIMMKILPVIGTAIVVHLISFFTNAIFENYTAAPTIVIYALAMTASILFIAARLRESPYLSYETSKTNKTILAVITVIVVLNVAAHGTAFIFNSEQTENPYMLIYKKAFGIKNVEAPLEIIFNHIEISKDDGNIHEIINSENPIEVLNTDTALISLTLKGGSEKLRHFKVSIDNEVRFETSNFAEEVLNVSLQMSEYHDVNKSGTMEIRAVFEGVDSLGLSNTKELIFLSRKAIDYSISNFKVVSSTMPITEGYQGNFEGLEVTQDSIVTIGNTDALYVKVEAISEADMEVTAIINDTVHRFRLDMENNTWITHFSGAVFVQGDNTIEINAKNERSEKSISFIVNYIPAGE